MADIKKFLDSAGVSTLWGQVKAEIAKIPTYDDAQVKADIAANKAAIEAEVSRADAAEKANAKAISDLTSSVATQISEAVASIVNEADDSYDTLKEIADWIKAHPDSVAALNSSIEANATAIDELEALVGDKAVATQITEALATYVTTANLNTTLADYATTAAMNTALANYVKSADVVAVHAQVETNKAGVASNLASINNLVSRLDGIVAQGGEPNVINNIKVNGVVQSIAADKSVDIAIPVIEALTESEIVAACK
jgi:hypothetical protein